MFPPATYTRILLAATRLTPWPQCDNERPKCRKCIDTGRECAGYTREMVFITGGLEDRGRVSSHPKREAGSSKKKVKTEEEEEGEDERLELRPTEPLTPAWDDLMSVSTQGVAYVVQIAALHTILQKVLRGNDEESGIRFNLSFSHFLPPELQATHADEDFQVNTQCFVHLSPSQKGGNELTDSYCFFLYQVCVARPMATDHPVRKLKLSIC